MILRGTYAHPSIFLGLLFFLEISFYRILLVLTDIVSILPKTLLLHYQDFSASWGRIVALLPRLPRTLPILIQKRKHTLRGGFKFGF
jgi:hypothetical protein